MRSGFFIAGVTVTALLTASTVFGQANNLANNAGPNGELLFNARCKSCHEPAIERAPSRTELSARAPASIVQALTNGPMVPMATGMSPVEIQAVAVFLTTVQPAAADANRRRSPPPIGTDKMCTTHPPIVARAGDWSTLAVSATGDRFQRHPELSSTDIPKLKLKWAFTMPGGGQPIVVGDWLFVTNRGAKFYALDAKTGCVHWTIEDAGSRTAPMVVRTSISPSGWATFIGVNGRVIRAIDAQTGKDIWRSESLDAHTSAVLTGSPVVSGEQLFVPLSSIEEGTAGQETYACCSFRGSLVALDLKTGRTQWQTYTITEPLRPTRKNASGVQLQGPAGGAIWSAPTVDEKRGLAYVVTGDSYTDAETKGADAAMAIEIKTGKVRWSHQVTENDNYVVACKSTSSSSNCPRPAGPDFDFGASPILFSLKNGAQVLVAGQKSGLVYGFKPDDGKLLWTTRVGSGSVHGGIEWGIGADDRHVFVPNADTALLVDAVRRKLGASRILINDDPPLPGLSAIDPANGKIVWRVPAPVAPCKYAGDRSGDLALGECVRAQSAAPAVIPGVVFSGTLDGWMRAYDANTGKIVWSFSTTAQTYDTVNGVMNHPGGSIDGMGPTVAHGMVYFMSGFNGAARVGGNGNNVLLAFSVDGK
jgi:polyvinyl alcohol dehydrogenase (cytochrome)